MLKMICTLLHDRAVQIVFNVHNRLKLKKITVNP